MYHYNFYQSALWKKINSELFLKPTFEVDFQDHIYQVICKEKKIFWIIVVRFQVLGSDKTLFRSLYEFQKSLLNAAKIYYQGKKFYPIYIQLGCTQVILQYWVQEYKTNSQIINDQFKESYSLFLKQNITPVLLPSSKHNLPDATIVIDCSIDRDALMSNISKNTKEKIKKAKKMIESGSLDIRIWKTLEDYEHFYSLYSQTAENKWFGAVTPRMWKSLEEFLIESDQGKLFLITDQESKLISGALCLHDRENLIYLYGANDRRYGNAGISQYLHAYIIEYAHQNKIAHYDLLGASRVGTNGDWLEKITQFKSGFGGDKVEYAWSCDLPFNKFAYWIYIRFS